MDIKKIKEDENGVFYEAYDKSKKSDNSIGFVLLKNNIGFIYKIYIFPFAREEIDFLDKKFKYRPFTYKFGSLVYRCENGVPKIHLILPMINKYYMRILYLHSTYFIIPGGIEDCECNHFRKNCLKHPESSYVIAEIIFKILTDLGHNEYKIVHSTKENMSRSYL